MGYTNEAEYTTYYKHLHYLYNISTHMVHERAVLSNSNPLLNFD